MTSSNLESFVRFSRPPPKVLFQSAPISDRDSIFVASIFRASSSDEVRAAVTQLRKVLHASNPASHEMHAYRTMGLRAGRDGLRGPDDFELHTGADDDGEKYGAAKILKTMESEGVLDAVVICSRWYGGTMIGPARFTHIETCTREVCQLFKALEQVEDCISQLTDLDVEIATLRARLAALKDPNAPPPPAAKQQDYKASLLEPRPDAPKAQRLVKARQGTITSLRNSIGRMGDPSS